MLSNVLVAIALLTQCIFAFSQVGSDSQLSVEEEAKRLAWADGVKNGIPRKISQEFNLIKVEAVGKKFIKTYEFAYQISPVSEQDRLALSKEARQNFKTNVCQSPLRPFLNRGLIFVQKINYFNSGNIVSNEFGQGDCR
ncbi:MAG TPA: hypothetical protein PLT54_00010 [Rhodoferax sp.]|jgi:hypothetical protein|nr:hypothetical protein [Rhodoferax sp.]